MLCIVINATTAKQLITVSVVCCVSRERGLDDVCQQLCVCNAVRDALHGEGLSVRFHQLLLKPSKRLVDFILEVGPLWHWVLKRRYVLPSAGPPPR